MTEQDDASFHPLIVNNLPGEGFPGKLLGRIFTNYYMWTQMRRVSYEEEVFLVRASCLSARVCQGGRIYKDQLCDLYMPNADQIANRLVELGWIRVDGRSYLL